MRFCNECTDKLLYKRRKIQSNESKEFEANSNLLKRQASKHIGHMLPFYKD